VALVTNTAISESLGYDILDRATNITWKTAGGTTVRGFGYSFNSAGMITNVSRENGGWTAYTYDSLDRLLSEKQFASTGLTYSASWNYDLAGNRTIAITNGVTNLYSYAVGNILTNFGSGTLVQHDLAGNITNLQYSASRKLALYWNGRYELIEARSNGVTVEKYDYDPLGRRARIIAGTVTNSFVYAGPHIVAEWSNNVLARSFSHGPGVDNILSMTTYGAATNTYFYLKDAIGSVHALVNTNGTVVEQYKYTAWGEVTVLSSNGTVLAASAYGNRFTFQGREASYSTGLLFFRSRYYSASLGRWLSKDKIGISGGANQYVFCANNPVNFTDPFGLAPGDPYPSPKAAGIQAGKDFGGVFQWLERAGLIYQKGNDFSYTAPAPLNTSTHLSSRPGAAQSQVPESAKIIGAWHTHPILSEPYLSPDDFVAANKFHKLGANFNVMTPAIGSPTVYGFDSEGKFFNKKASDPSAPCGK